MMVDAIVKSKKDTPPKILWLVMLLQCSFFKLREIVKVKEGLTTVKGLNSGVISKVG